MTRTTTPAAVLWDMDGTIIDSEPYWIAAERVLVERFGAVWTDEHTMAVVGQSLWFSAELLRTQGVDMPAAEIIATLTAQVIEAVRAEVPWRPGALELLTALRADGVPMALVTMSFADLAGVVAEELEAVLGGPAFDAVVTGDAVTNGKPHPEPYLVAAERLGVDPADCVAFEDSVPGLTSAVAAGCVGVGVPHLVELDGVAGATLWPTLEGRTPADVAAVAGVRA